MCSTWLASAACRCCCIPVVNLRHPKVAQGVPHSQVMMPTGHQAEASFNHCLSVNEAELLTWYRKTARRVS